MSIINNHILLIFMKFKTNTFLEKKKKIKGKKCQDLTGVHEKTEMEGGDGKYS